MTLLNQIAASSTPLYELLGTQKIKEAEGYEARGWVTIKRTKPSKGLATYGQRQTFAMITDAGRAAAQA